MRRVIERDERVLQKRGAKKRGVRGERENGLRKRGVRGV